jgi:predicted Rossmann-fold nucleotide-binding protein
MVVVDDMHQRKAEMARLADAFIALPGIYINIPAALLPPSI